MRVRDRVLRIVTVTAFLSLLSPSVWAIGKLQGYVEQGAQRHLNSGVFAITRGGSAQTNPYSQQSYPQASVLVCKEGYDCNADPTKKATIYSDSARTAKANPFTASTNGWWEFYTDEVTVDIRFSGGGIATPYTWTSLPVPEYGGVSLRPANLYSFGAKGDGTTDDTTAITNWISFGGTNTVPCYAPSGSFVTTEKIAISTDGMEIYGDSKNLTKFINKASAGKPTFFSDSAQYVKMHDLAIVGRATFPNTGIQFAVNAGGTDSGGFWDIHDIMLVPNGIGIHFNGNSVGGYGGLNSYTLRDIYYWPSGWNVGATAEVANLKHAILADGTGVVNDVYINNLNAVGVAQSSDANRACIKWNTGGLSGNVIVNGGELEGVDLRAIDYTNVWGFTIRDPFVENSQLRFDTCRYGRISGVNAVANHSGGAKAITVIGSSQLMFADFSATSAGTEITFDAGSSTCALINVSINTVTNSGSFLTEYNSISSASADSLTAGRRAFKFGIDTAIFSTGCAIYSGSGTPEGAVAAPVCSVFLRTNGGADSTMYLKTSGSGNTGWQPVDTTP